MKQHKDRYFHMGAYWRQLPLSIPNLRQCFNNSNFACGVLQCIIYAKTIPRNTKLRRKSKVLKPDRIRYYY